MMKAVSVVALGAPVLADFCDEGIVVRVEPLVFSGTPDPQFQLNAEQREAFCDFLKSSNGAAKKVPTCRAVGFAGWQACANGECNKYRGEAFLDHLFLAALEAAHPQLPDGVLRHITEETRRLGPEGDVECLQAELAPVPNAQCDGHNRGSDDPNEVHYDDEHDADGCFVAMQSSNNCYDYGIDIATNTFRIPGCGSGHCWWQCHEDAGRLCTDMTCEAVKNGAISDGLQWVGTDLPTALPEKGHYVSLHIWNSERDGSGVNYHWVRMNADGGWSHKPGMSSVRDHDNQGNKITNPHEADLSPWNEHCGYMLAIPSMSQIKAAAVIA